ncbi:hypothetical protein BKA70DRAFT_201145 [Coprinopsis sp. MPI-PUGE-AT-0042]|nr:hypothetical protein BKA70DRAFT_201145 [Coprinopsis sp. MPI-PUGE-AT-0042]
MGSHMRSSSKLFVWLSITNDARIVSTWPASRSFWLITFRPFQTRWHCCGQRIGVWSSAFSSCPDTSHLSMHLSQYGVVGLQAQGATLGACAVGFGASTLLIGLSMLIAEAIMLVRLYALSGRSKIMLAWICVQLIAVLATILPGLSFFVKSVKFMKSPLRNVTGCLPNRFEEEFLLLVYATVGASQIALMLLSSWVAWRNYKGSGSPILAAFYQDGLIYFLCLTLVTIGNIIFYRVGPPEARFMLTLPQGVLHSILSCRLILHIHQVAFRDLKGTEKYPEFSGIDFAKPSDLSSSRVTRFSDGTWTERTIGQATTSSGETINVRDPKSARRTSTVIQFKPVSTIISTLASTLTGPTQQPHIEEQVPS